MSGWLDQFVFPEDWVDLRSLELRSEVDRLAVQLRSELRSGHVLAAGDWRVVGRSSARDDVVVHLPDSDTVKVVHLTYGGPQSPPWPSTTASAHSPAEARALLLSRD